MEGTPWSDGVPGITQRPILPGESFSYKWKATQYGSHWYHAHFRGQIEDGMYGAILIHPRPDDPKPFHLIDENEDVINAMIKAEKDVKPLVVTDFTHLTSRDKWDFTLEAKTEISCYDSILFNGKGRVECLSEEKITSHLSEIQKAYLALVSDANMTDKACLPAKVMDAFAGGTGKPEKMPDGIFEDCKPTDGQIETIPTSLFSCAKETWVAIDIIGAVNFITAVLSIDEHDMWIYAMDGAYIEPQKVQALVVTNGDRYSVLVKAHKEGDFKIRFNANSAPQIIAGHALLTVAGPEWQDDYESKPWIDIVGSPLSEDVVMFDQATARPFPAVEIPKEADASFILSMNLDGASYLWAMNSTRFMPDTIDTRQAPTLFNPKPWISNNVTITTKNDTWVDLVFLADAFPMPPHPIHKHGNKMYQIGTGSGPFNYSSVNAAIKAQPQLFNLVDPPRRDAFASPPTETDVAWTAVRYHVSNPGPWLLHCHVNNHLVGGMVMVIQDGVDAWPKIPDEYLLH